MKKPRNIVGPVIRRLREAQGMTQPELVARLNLKGWDISRETLAKLETQVRWVADFELVQLAEVLNSDAGDILKESSHDSAKRRRS